MSLNEVDWRKILTDHKSFPRDVEIRVTEEEGGITEIFYCHKILLAAVSPFFQEVFFGKDFSPSKCGKMAVLEIHKQNPKAFQKVLEFIYQQKKPFNLDISKQTLFATRIGLLMDITELAVKFKLQKLEKFCQNYGNMQYKLAVEENYHTLEKLLLVRSPETVSYTHLTLPTILLV